MFKDLLPADVLAAAERIRGLVTRTPMVRSPQLSGLAGGDVHLKLELQQITGSFKVRGALNALMTLPDDVAARGVVASSAGNHGLGVAYAARQLGIPATIFVPSTAPAVKRDGIAALGATIDTSQPDYDRAMEAAIEFATRNGVRYINPCLGDSLLAGQGTVALEILADLPEVRSIILPVGGGGLLGGTGCITRAVAPMTAILGVQSENTAAMARSVEARKVVTIAVLPTLADGLAGQIDEEALEIGMYSLDEIVTVGERSIERAIAWLAREHDLKVEGSGAVGVAALLDGRLHKLATPAVIILTGANIDDGRHERIVSGNTISP
jgi:threonine dehydratase